MYDSAAAELGLCQDAAVCPTDPAGVFMAYSSMGTFNESWMPAIEASFYWRNEYGVNDLDSHPELLQQFLSAHGSANRTTPLYSALGQNFAATVQHAFEALLLRKVLEHFEPWNAHWTKRGFETAIGLVGGCALNIVRAYMHVCSDSHAVHTRMRAHVPM